MPAAIRATNETKQHRRAIRRIPTTLKLRVIEQG
jgi:hypothetical protein